MLHNLRICSRYSKSCTNAGHQGAAKTSLMEFIKTLVDPSAIKTLSFPTDINELIQQLSHNYLAYYDNVSVLRDRTSDQLCRAVTGSGSSKRVLYSDDDDFIRSFKRCIGLNGINLAATNLLDRALFFELKRIENKDRCCGQSAKMEKYLRKCQFGASENGGLG